MKSRVLYHQERNIETNVSLEKSKASFQHEKVINFDFRVILRANNCIYSWSLKAIKLGRTAR